MLMLNLSWLCNTDSSYLKKYSSNGVSKLTNQT